MSLETYPFWPRIPLDYRVVERTSGNTSAIDDAVDAIVGHFTGGPVPALRYLQYPRMGRACCIATTNDDAPCVGAKGIGPGWASEILRAHWDQRNQKMFADRGEPGGCVRLPTQPPYFVFYSRDDRRRCYSLAQASPEGLSPFSGTLQEFVISEVVYKQLHITAARSLALLRRTMAAPWKNSQLSMNEWLISAFNAVLRERGDQTADYRFDMSELDDDPSTQRFVLGSDLNFGLLIRDLGSPVCLQDIYADAVRGRWSDVRAQLTRLGEYSKAAPPWSERLLVELARTAALMVDNGVLHEQLSAHYQDYSADGGIKDFDTTFVSPYTNPTLATEVRDALERHDRLVREQYDARVKQVMPSEEAAAFSLIAMSNAICSTVLRFRDIAKRAPGWTNGPGTVLSRDEIAAVRTRFIELMVGSLSPRGLRVLEVAERAMQDESQRNDLSNHNIPCLWEGFPTPLGWTQQDRPINYELHNCTQKDIAFIVSECESFVRQAIEFAPRVQSRQLVVSNQPLREVALESLAERARRPNPGQGGVQSQRNNRPRHV